MIPILDLTRQYAKLKDQIDKEVINVLGSGKYINGPNCKKLMEDTAKYLDCKRTIGVGNGTDALQLALMALDIGPGDEVITVAFTFVATTEAIGIVGATPVFADIDPVTYNIDPKSIEDRITDKTKAILPVHLYGQPCEMDAIMAIAKKNNLYVVEDCAQAIGAEYKGKKVGTFGEFGCFSFFPTKNLGCFGDGGLVSTNDDALADRIVALRGHGGKVKYYHDELGMNSRLDEVQAAILNCKLPHIDDWNDARRKVAYRYNELLKDVEGITTPGEIDDVKCVYHQYTVRVPERDNMQKVLKEAGVMSMIYYPVPLHKQKVHAHLTPPELPVTDAATEVVLSLPIFPELTEQEQDKVVEEVKKNVVALVK